MELFNSTPTVLEEVLAATRSTRPSPFRSAAATPEGVIAAGQEVQPQIRLEGTVPVAEEHGKIARGGPQLIRHGSVHPAVVIEVAQGQIATPAGLSGGEDGTLEGAVAMTQQHPELKSVAIEHGDALDHQVELAVAVDVAQGHGLRREVLAAGRKDQGPRERAVAVAQQHADGVGELLRRHHVEPAVAVEVTDRDRVRGPADGQVDPGPEGAVAVAQQHAEGAVAVRRHQVEGAIVVEVAGRHGEGGLADAEDQVVRLERAVAFAQQDFHRGARGASGVQGDVGQAVAVEVAHRRRLGVAVAEAAVEDVGGDSRLERTIAVPQQHTQAALGGGGRRRSLVDDREIRLAVVVEVRHRDRAGKDADRESDRGQKTENRTIFQCFQRQFAPLGRPRQRPGLLQQAMQPGQCHEMNPPRKKKQGRTPPRRGRGNTMLGRAVPPGRAPDVSPPGEGAEWVP